MMLNWGHIYRVIPLDNRPHPSSDVRMWMGSARGHFEGDTLVIETTNLNGKMWLDSGGNFIGPNAKVTERIRLVSAERPRLPGDDRRSGDVHAAVDADRAAAASGRRRQGGAAAATPCAIPTRPNRGSTRATKATASTRTSIRAARVQVVSAADAAQEIGPSH